MINSDISTAYHEAGHALASILANRKFKYVTIRRQNDKAGELVHYRRIRHKYSIDQVDLFSKSFKHDFITCAGFMAEKSFIDSPDIEGSIDDLNRVNFSVSGLPENLQKSYHSFLAEYTITILQEESNHARLKRIAEALIERETLSYSEVINLFKS